MTTRTPKLTCDEVIEVLKHAHPTAHTRAFLEEVASMRARVRMPFRESFLRPGGTLSGPAMFFLADFTFYAATLAMIGPEPLTVTTNASIQFLRKPPPQDLYCEAQIKKLGQRLAMGECTLFVDDITKPVAYATLSYALPEGMAKPTATPLEAS